MVVRFVVKLGPICCDDNMQHFAVSFINIVYLQIYVGVVVFWLL
jgi:hypothetical protein